MNKKLKAKKARARRKEFERARNIINNNVERRERQSYREQIFGK